jgi:hypothetical protein
MLQTINGQICKIVLNLTLPTQQLANPVAIKTLNYYLENLGNPSKQQTGLFIWDTTDGNVLMKTGEFVDGSNIGLFLTSRAVRSFQRLRRF